MMSINSISFGISPLFVRPCYNNKTYINQGLVMIEALLYDYTVDI